MLDRRTPRVAGGARALHAEIAVSGPLGRTGGRTLSNQELRPGRMFRLPVFARKGAILPKMFVDDKTMNVLGRRSDGTRRDGLVVRVYPSDEATSFVLYEDDNETIAYKSGELRQTTLRQEASAASAKVVIDGAHGTFVGALGARANVVELATNSQRATGVTQGTFSP